VDVISIDEKYFLINLLGRIKNAQRKSGRMDIDSCFLNLNDKSSKTDGISAVVCAKNRTDNLLISLGSWLEISKISEIIILDFGSDIPITIPYNDPRIKLYRYESKYWHLSKAYNIALQLATQKILVKLDADYILKKNFLLYNNIDTNSFIKGPSRTSLNGFLMIYKSNFLRVNGYNEKIINWGAEDTDLYYRLVNIKLNKKILVRGTAEHIYHPEILRTKYVHNPTLDKKITSKYNISHIYNNPWTINDKMSSYYDN